MPTGQEEYIPATGRFREVKYWMQSKVRCLHSGFREVEKCCWRGWAERACACTLGVGGCSFACPRLHSACLPIPAQSTCM